ncbi:hypothetical protein HBB16_08675 [Pseudonocardia sp. MCCB 268]|nr:hypothetical protein [Pseudonocardia cytotoxica]
MRRWLERGRPAPGDPGITAGVGARRPRRTPSICAVARSTVVHRASARSRAPPTSARTGSGTPQPRTCSRGRGCRPPLRTELFRSRHVNDSALHPRELRTGWKVVHDQAHLGVRRPARRPPCPNCFGNLATAPDWSNVAHRPCRVRGSRGVPWEVLTGAPGAGSGLPPSAGRLSDQDRGRTDGPWSQCPIGPRATRARSGPEPISSRPSSDAAPLWREFDGRGTGFPAPHRRASHPAGPRGRRARGAASVADRAVGPDAVRHVRADGGRV